MGETVPNDSDSGGLSPEATAALDGAFAVIAQYLLPELESSGTEDRRKRARMGDISEPFVSKVRDYSESNPEFMPPYADQSVFKRAVAKIEALRPYQRRFAQYKSMLDDTIGIAGSDALDEGALPYYKTVKEAAKKKKPAAATIAADLGMRYAALRGPRKAAPAASQEPPADPPGSKD